MAVQTIVAAGASAHRGPVGVHRKRLTARKLARTIREAKRDYLAGFPIDWSQFGEPVVEGLECTRTIYTAERPYGMQVPDSLQAARFDLVWTKKDDPEIQIALTDIWWGEDTGAILQAGNNYGRLVM